jgi:hypothetical protein
VYFLGSIDGGRGSRVKDTKLGVFDSALAIAHLCVDKSWISFFVVEGCCCNQGSSLSKCENSIAQSRGHTSVEEDVKVLYLLHKPSNISTAKRKRGIQNMYERPREAISLLATRQSYS